jgi:hypothetical protein
MKTHRVIIDYQPPVTLDVALSMTRLYRSLDQAEPALFVDFVHVSRLAPDHFLVRRVEPAE